MNSLTSSHPQSENAAKIVVTEVIGDTLCITSEDGQKVYQQIAAAFKEGKKVGVAELRYDWAITVDEGRSNSVQIRVSK